MTDDTQPTITDDVEPVQADPEPTVRVPNVRANAVSGIERVPLGGDVPAGGLLPPIDQAEGTLLAPSGLDLDGLLAWVQEGETVEERAERAEAVWNAEVDYDDQEGMGDLSASLTAAVERPDPEDLPAIPEDAVTVDALLAWVNDTDDATVRDQRARVVLAAEEQRDPKRTTLTEPLLAIVAPAAPPAG